MHHRSLLVCVPSMCLCAHVCLYMCMRVCVRVCVCVRACVGVCARIYTHVSSKALLEYVKIYHSSGTFDSHSSLAIFDKHLVW